MSMWLRAPAVSPLQDFRKLGNFGCRRMGGKSYDTSAEECNPRSTDISLPVSPARTQKRIPHVPTRSMKLVSKCNPFTSLDNNITKAQNPLSPTRYLSPTHPSTQPVVRLSIPRVCLTPSTSKPTISPPSNPIIPYRHNNTTNRHIRT
jgi:hypothetical protein